MDIRNVLSSTLATTITALLGTLALPASSLADEQITWFGQEARGQFLAGIKLGTMEPNQRGYSDANTTSILVGYQFARPIGEGGTASVEFELTNSDDGDVQGNSWDASARSVFMTYRSPGTVYYKIKGGIMNSEVDTNFSTGNDESGDTNFAYGMGLGYRMGTYQDINLEGEWVGTSGDIDLNMFNVGMQVHF